MEKKHGFTIVVYRWDSEFFSRELNDWLKSIRVTAKLIVDYAY